MCANTYDETCTCYPSRAAFDADMALIARQSATEHAVFDLLRDAAAPADLLARRFAGAILEDARSRNGANVSDVFVCGERAVVWWALDDGSEHHARLARPSLVRAAA
ncbi:hypothetical protein [Paraburkholderia sp. JHI869]|uniref:hypothetical protein n=1 Tax=Paraburkholderia sp. JHI869 TaxID=3112959 RepID=UPI00317AAF5C